MSWRDDLARVTLPDGRVLIGASFRGVPFFVEQVERRGGRRTVSHEFPLRDDPFIDDLGRRARQFPIEGYVVGDDYLDQKNALLAAVEDTAGPGELVHPYYGALRAICASYSVRESIREGRFATFSLEFQEAPAQSVTPTEEVDALAQVVASADAALAGVGDDLVSTYDVSDSPSFALASLTAKIEETSARLEDSMSDVTMAAQEAARVAAEIRLLSEQAASLVLQPLEALEQLQESLTLMAAAVADAPRPLLGAFVRIAEDLVPDLTPGDTPIRVQERTNNTSLTAAFRAAFAIASARLLVEVEYETLEDATADRTSVVDLLEELAGEAADLLYPLLAQLRSDVLRAVPGTAVLARVLRREERVAVPSLLLAFRLYGSVDQEQDIVARNRIRHPGFVSGDLQVLSDAG